MNSLSRALMIAGIVLLAAGLLLQVFPGFPILGKLPGDIRIERPGFRLYFPIASCLLLSALLSAAFWIVSRLR